MKKIVLFLLIIFGNIVFNLEDCLCQWEPELRLTSAYGESYLSHNNAKCIAANGNILHVVWFDSRYGDWEIYYKRSADLGLTWEPDIRLTYSVYESWFPSISVSNSNVHVVWEDYRNGIGTIYYKRSTDGGTSWGQDYRLTINYVMRKHPSVAASGNFVYVVWEEEKNNSFKIYYKRSTNNGETWGANIQLSDSNSHSSHSSIVVSDSIVNVVWYDERDGNYEIYYKRSTDRGISWGADTHLTNNTAKSWYPSITVNGSTLHLVFNDERDGNSEIYYKCSTNGGLNWGSDIRLTNDTAYSKLPSVAALGSFVNIVWYEERDGNYEIYYKFSSDSGITWGEDLRLTNNSAYSYYPFITLSNFQVHVIYSDFRHGNFEIYYKRNPTGNIGIQNISSEIPKSFTLEQNYPNPFNAMTKIQFNVPLCHSHEGLGYPQNSRHSEPLSLCHSHEGGNPLVVLKVFDILGKEVATLVNESLQPGTYETTFDASNLSSGIYFYQLRSDNFIQTKKLTLIR